MLFFKQSRTEGRQTSKDWLEQREASLICTTKFSTKWEQAATTATTNDNYDGHGDDNDDDSGNREHDDYDMTKNKRNDAKTVWSNSKIKMIQNAVQTVWKLYEKAPKMVECTRP